MQWTFLYLQTRPAGRGSAEFPNVSTVPRVGSFTVLLDPDQSKASTLWAMSWLNDRSSFACYFLGAGAFVPLFRKAPMIQRRCKPFGWNFGGKIIVNLGQSRDVATVSAQLSFQPALLPHVSVVGRGPNVKHRATDEGCGSTPPPHTFVKVNSFIWALSHLMLLLCKLGTVTWSLTTKSKMSWLPPRYGGVLGAGGYSGQNI